MSGVEHFVCGATPQVFGVTFVLAGASVLKIFWRSVPVIPVLHVNKRRLPAYLPTNRKIATSVLILQENYHEKTHR
jgi:hypothetical protein